VRQKYSNHLIDWRLNIRSSEMENWWFS